MTVDKQGEGHYNSQLVTPIVQPIFEHLSQVMDGLFYDRSDLASVVQGNYAVLQWATIAGILIGMATTICAGLRRPRWVAERFATVRQQYRMTVSCSPIQMDVKPVGADSRRFPLSDPYPLLITATRGTYDRLCSPLQSCSSSGKARNIAATDDAGHRGHEVAPHRAAPFISR